MKTQHNDEMQWIHHIPQYYDTFLIVKPGFLKRSHIILETFCNGKSRLRLGVSIFLGHIKDQN